MPIRRRKSFLFHRDRVSLLLAAPNPIYQQQEATTTTWTVKVLTAGNLITIVVTVVEFHSEAGDFQ